MYDTVRWLIERERERERELPKMFPVLQLFFLLLTLSVPPAQRHWPKTTEGYAVIPVQYYIIINAAKLNRQNLNSNFNP